MMVSLDSQTSPTSMTALTDMRTDYRRASLDEADVCHDPIAQFARWLDEARQAHIPEANAMSLATVNADQRPSSRIVLLKEFDHRGFVWYTHYTSSKGLDLAQRPYAALLFHWVELERQVRIEGRVEKVSPEQSDVYFQSRPLASRLGAIASAQSDPVPDRATLERQFDAAATRYPEHPPRPANWGGYRLAPEKMEFWQGRSSRLHDRLVFERSNSNSNTHGADHDNNDNTLDDSLTAWTIERLQP